MRQGLLAFARRDVAARLVRRDDLAKYFDRCAGRKSTAGVWGCLLECWWKPQRPQIGTQGIGDLRVLKYRSHFSRIGGVMQDDIQDAVDVNLFQADLDEIKHRTDVTWSRIVESI